MINARNYLINCVSLISSAGASRVIWSRNQKQAAEFLDSCKEEEIFGTSLGLAHGKWTMQVDSDLDYAEIEIQNYGASLQSATDQLTIAGERELGEIAHHISVDSAAVVASVAAILIVEFVVIEIRR